MIHQNPISGFEDNYSKYQSLSFKQQIQMLVTELDNNKAKEIPLSSLYPKLNVKRRRLYDVINVFTAIGCSRKSGVDFLIWNGKSQIISELISQIKSHRIKNWNLSLDELFPVNHCVSLTSLASAFLLLFAALDVDTIDLRTACSFFSRDTNRYKTTLCKMYQIILILSALDIVTKTEKVCKIKLLSPYLECLTESNHEIVPTSIDFLLNTPSDAKHNSIERRRNDFVESQLKRSVIPEPNFFLVNQILKEQNV